MPGGPSVKVCRVDEHGEDPVERRLRKGTTTTDKLGHLLDGHAQLEEARPVKHLSPIGTAVVLNRVNDADLQKDVAGVLKCAGVPVIELSPALPLRAR